MPGLNLKIIHDMLIYIRKKTQIGEYFSFYFPDHDKGKKCSNIADKVPIIKKLDNMKATSGAKTQGHVIPSSATKHPT